jgi:hypothetical protein
VFKKIAVMALMTMPLFGASRNDLIISEIMFDPASVADSVGEYIEIYNNSEDVINLMGWTIRDDGSNSDTISSSVPVPVGGYVVIGKNDDKSFNGGIDVDYVCSSFTLHNTSDELILEDPDGLEVFALRYLSGAWSQTKSSGKAFELVDFSSYSSAVDPLQTDYVLAIDQMENGDFGSAGHVGGGLFIAPEPLPVQEIVMDMTETHDLITTSKEEILSSLTGKATATQALILDGKDELLSAVSAIPSTDLTEVLSLLNQIKSSGSEPVSEPVASAFLLSTSEIIKGSGFASHFMLDDFNITEVVGDVGRLKDEKPILFSLPRTDLDSPYITTYFKSVLVDGVYVVKIKGDFLLNESYPNGDFYMNMNGITYSESDGTGSTISGLLYNTHLVNGEYKYNYGSMHTSAGLISFDKQFSSTEPFLIWFEFGYVDM